MLVQEARETLVARLIPKALVVTPNIPEAKVLSKKPIRTKDDIHEAARVIHTMGARYVLIKGGHLDGPATDCLYDGEDFLEFSKLRIDTPHTHGTGCIYSAAIATYLAMELEIKEAVQRAKDFIHSAIRFVTPDDRHYGREEDILANRLEVYEKARRQNPNRWSRDTRNWDPVRLVWLNPDDKDRDALNRCLSEAA